VSDVLVLSYHAVSERWPAALSVTPRQLDWQLRLLVERGYRGRTFAEAVRAGGDAKVVAVTFDDAYRSVLERAFPILSGLGLPGTVFVPTDFAGAGAPMSWPGIDQWVGSAHEPELAPLSWDELKTLADAGWEIGSHTSSHAYLTRLSDEELERELADSRRLIEQVLGRPCVTLAYPYGDHDDRVIRAAAAAGYEAACTVPRRLTPPAPLAWPRVGIYHGNGRLTFRAKVSPAARRLRRTGAWAAADSVRRRARRRLARSSR
jgi:peptidoglycan/xylan/chitin deacetylase (PgdA/CDA1 family)